MDMSRITPDKHYLTDTQGKPFFILGVTYNGYFDRPWVWWEDDKFEPDLVKRDFQKMITAGLNTIRLLSSEALAKDVKANNFTKLDTVLQAAAQARLSVILTLNEAQTLNLAEVVDLDKKIVQRYRDDPVILAWDLEDGLNLFKLVAATYPHKHPLLSHTERLYQHYKWPVSQQATAIQQREGHLPAFLSLPVAHAYANMQYLWQACVNAATQWAQQQQQTVVDYFQTDDSRAWRPFLDILNQIYTVWLDLRRAALAQLDPNHLFTLSHDHPLWGSLPANRSLDFLSFSEQDKATLINLDQTFQTLNSLKTLFPKQPLLVSEFSYTSVQPRISRFDNQYAAIALDLEQVPSLFEAAFLAHLRVKKIAGGLKWALNDMDEGRSQNTQVGLYRIGDHPKPLQILLKHFSRDWPAPPSEGQLWLRPEQSRLAFRLDMKEGEPNTEAGTKTNGQQATMITLGGRFYQDESLNWAAKEITYCVLTVKPSEMTLQALGDGLIALTPWQIMPRWNRYQEPKLYRIEKKKRYLLTTFSSNQLIAWPVKAGLTYYLTLNQETQPQPNEMLVEANILPNPGEHILILADPNTALRQALPYIRHFAPDVSFTTRHVSGRWAYVTVIGAPEQISDAVLNDIRATGAALVERIDGDVPQILQTLVTQNRRFLTEPNTPIPDDAPVSIPTPLVPLETTSALSENQLYTVQPSDSLVKIAQKIYGQVDLWPLIFQANRDILTSPDRIRPGMQLKMPAK